MKVRDSGHRGRRALLRNEHLGRGRDGGRRAAGDARPAMRRIRVGVVLRSRMVAGMVMIGAVIVGGGRPGVVMADRHAYPRRDRRHPLQRYGEGQHESR